jgi:predicted small secreted protein
MNARKIIMTLTLLALWVGMFSLNGCNTWKGAGKDVERGGERMQGKD